MTPFSAFSSCCGCGCCAAEQRRRQIVRVWRLADSRTDVHKAMAPVQRALKQAAVRQPWFEQACDVWVDDINTGNRIPKVGTGEGREERREEGGSCLDAQPHPTTQRPLRESCALLLLL